MNKGSPAQLSNHVILREATHKKWNKLKTFRSEIPFACFTTFWIWIIRFLKVWVIVSFPNFMENRPWYNSNFWKVCFPFLLPKAYMYSWDNHGQNCHHFQEEHLFSFELITFVRCIMLSDILLIHRNIFFFFSSCLKYHLFYGLMFFILIQLLIKQFR